METDTDTDRDMDTDIWTYGHEQGIWTKQLKLQKVTMTKRGPYATDNKLCPIYTVPVYMYILYL
jgi:hypothetical protein